MPLNVQDPTTPISNANSYLSLVDARALAEQYYYELPTDDTEAEKALVKSFRAIEVKEPQMCGERATTEQNSSYPRNNVTIRCQPVLSDELPSELLLAQVIGAQYSGAGTDLSGGTDNGRSIASSTAGKVAQTYFDNGKTGSQIKVVEFDDTLKPLMCTNSSGAQFTVNRV